MIINSIFGIVDARISDIESQDKQASVIILNAKLFKQMQQEMMFQDMSQAYGKVRSPFDLQVYRGIKVIPSMVVDTVEVF
jgi:hypothetical protein